MPSWRLYETLLFGNLGFLLDRYSGDQNEVECIILIYVRLSREPYLYRLNGQLALEQVFALPTHDLRVLNHSLVVYLAHKVDNYFASSWHVLSCK